MRFIYLAIAAFMFSSCCVAATDDVDVSKIKFDDGFDYSRLADDDYQKVRIACEKDNDAEACYKYASYWRGRSILPEESDGSWEGSFALKAAAKSCKLGNKSGCELFFIITDEDNLENIFYSFPENIDKPKDEVKSTARTFMLDVVKTSCTQHKNIFLCSIAAGAEGNSKQRLDLLKEGADQGDDWCSAQLSEAYQYGNLGLSKDESKAEEIAKKGCLKGGKQSCHQYAELIEKENKELSEKLNAKACAAGVVEACTSLAGGGSLFVWGLMDKGPDDEEVNYTARACALGHADSCVGYAGWKLGQLVNGDKGRELKAALDKWGSLDKMPPEELERINKVIEKYKEETEEVYAIFELACYRGAPEGCEKVGKKDFDDDNFRESFKFFERGSKSRYFARDATINCYSRLGAMYEEGKGTLQNFDKAKEMYDMSCPRIPQDCLNLGRLYLGDKNQPIDIEKAKKYFGDACEAGEQKGCDAYAKINEAQAKSKK